LLNTQKFNLGKFNVIGGWAVSISATIIAKSGMEAFFNVAYRARGEMTAHSGLDVLQPARVIPFMPGEMAAESGLSARYYRRVPMLPLPIDALSGMTAQTAAVFGVDVLSLPQIVLRPGQELIIDTDNMTATIDGQNAIHLLSDDSVFFLLAQGEDIITYSDNSGSRHINIKVMYKNRWL